MAKIKTPEDLKTYRQAINDIGYKSSYGARILKGDTDYEVGRAAEGTES